MFDFLLHVLYSNTCSYYRIKWEFMKFSIGKVSAVSGCNIETIRFYEKQGLLLKPGRTQGGHRIYSDEMIDRLMFIRRCRGLGFSMEEIRQLLSLVDGEQVSCERVKAMALDNLQDIRSKIDDLKKMESTLQKLSSQCSGEDVPYCPIIEELQAL